MLAEKQAREPERDLLLADAARALEKKARGERSACVCVAKALTKRRMAVDWCEGHGSKIGVGAPRRAVSMPAVGGA